VGNPNCGKTSLFNALTGSNQRVGNYAGVTVERRSGRLRVGKNGASLDAELLDLPGLYSLASYSPEEKVTQDELLSGEIDLAVVVVDATALKRSLVLLAQMMQLELRLVLVLNMSDEAERAGQRLDLPLLEKMLGFPVVATVGSKGEGIDALLEAMVKALRRDVAPSKLVLGERVDAAIAAVVASLDAQLPEEPRRAWLATRLLLSDERYVEQFAGREEAAPVMEEVQRQRERLERESGHDVQLCITEHFFGFVDGLLHEVVRTPARQDARAISDRIDAVLANRLLGLPFFFFTMYVIFWVTFALGEYPMAWLETGFDALGAGVGSLWPEGSDSLLRSLLVEGVLPGVGGVLVFLPNIVLLFLGLSILEDTGYMARAAFLVDAVMHKFGLHGRSFIPLITGLGCSVPGIMATRTLASRKDRLATMMVVPLMSCGARLPIWLLLIPAFFAPEWRAPMLWGMYLIGIVLALLLALLLRKVVLRGDDEPFVMELPPYRVPTLRNALRQMTEKAWLYLKKAGTIILAFSVIMWALAQFPKPAELSEAGHAELELRARAEGVEPAQLQQREALQASVLGRVGSGLEPALAPLGFDWRIGTALVGAFAGKELFVSQLGIVYALDEGDEHRSLETALRRDYSPLTGFTLMLFMLVAMPCVATLAVLRKESGSWRWALGAFFGHTLLAYVLCLLVFQIGSSMGLG
jgi:ferrous iron transport protein B